MNMQQIALQIQQTTYSNIHQWSNMESGLSVWLEMEDQFMDPINRTEVCGNPARWMFATGGM